MAETIADDDRLAELRKERLAWLASQEIISVNPAMGKWRMRILDAADYQRPKRETVKLGYVHGASGIYVGHALSLLSECVGAGSWTLPLEIGWIPPKSDPNAYGVAQLDEFVKRHGWPEKQALAVDAPNLFSIRFTSWASRFWGAWRAIVYSSCRRHLIRVLGVGGGAGGRSSSTMHERCQRSMPGKSVNSRMADASRSAVGMIYRCESGLDKGLALYRVIKYKADSKLRYKCPLWLIFVPVSIGIELPAPREAQAIYDERFSVEDTIRFMKRRFGIDMGAIQ